MRYYYYLMGRISQQKGLSPQSLDYFERAFSLLPFQSRMQDEHAFFLDALAEATEEARNTEKAARYREQIRALTLGRLRWGDIYNRVLAPK
jgi:excinuclease UvrABC nuclease subunit